jgi:hypothetical protein
MIGVTVHFHTCPVCRREIAETGGVQPGFYRHRDTAGNWCPMSGQPIPISDGSE